MTLRSRAQSRKGERFSRERKRARLFLSRAMRACPHCTEKCVRQLAHICSEKSGRQLDRFCSSGRGSVRAATAGTVAPSHPFLTFGRLTTKFEMPFQFLKVKPHRCGKVVPSRLSHLRSASTTTEFEMLFQTKKQGCRRQPCSLSLFDR